MTSSKMENTHSSPLLQIQRTEAERASMIAAAHEAAEERLNLARRQAAQLKREATDTGRREGEADYEEIVSEAHSEAERILVQARQQANGLRHNSEQHIDAMVDHAWGMIIELQKEVDLA